jgi:hypothetical protein
MERKINFYRKLILEKLDQVKYDIGFKRYDLYVNMVYECNSLEELQEMADLELQLIFLQYANGVKKRVEEKGLTMDDIIDRESYIDNELKENLRTIENIDNQDDEEVENGEDLELTASYMRNILKSQQSISVYPEDSEDVEQKGSIEIEDDETYDEYEYENGNKAVTKEDNQSGEPDSEENEDDYFNDYFDADEIGENDVIIKRERAESDSDEDDDYILEDDDELDEYFTDDDEYEDESSRTKENDDNCEIKQEDEFEDYFTDEEDDLSDKENSDYSEISDDYIIMDEDEDEGQEINFGGGEVRSIKLDKETKISIRGNVKQSIFKDSTAEGILSIADRIIPKQKSKD